jgi:hypothetical protein
MRKLMQNPDILEEPAKSDVMLQQPKPSSFIRLPPIKGIQIAVNAPFSSEFSSSTGLPQQPEKPRPYLHTLLEGSYQG